MRELLMDATALMAGVLGQDVCKERLCRRVLPKAELPKCFHVIAVQAMPGCEMVIEYQEGW